MTRIVDKRTLATHPPEVELPAGNRPLIAPIYQSVKFEFDDVASTLEYFHGEREGFYYSRLTNPTLRQLELTLCGLQEREACLLTGSGVAALSMTMLALLRAGDHVVYFAEMYQPTRAFLRRTVARYGVRSTVLSIDDLAALETTLAATPTRLVVFESPTNPVLKIADLEAITTLARRFGALTLLDNTLAGLHQHGEYPVDLIAHSLTKYASGHGDVMGGAVLASRTLIDTLKHDFTLLGPTLDPHAAYLLQRGLRSYFPRWETQCANALRVAGFLAGSPGVRKVRYPGLPGDPGYALACRQMREFGTLVCFDIDGELAAGTRFAESLELFALAASLGSTESLVVPPAMMQPRDLDATQRGWSGIGSGTVRLSIGTECVDDLISDLRQALARATGPSRAGE